MTALEMATEFITHMNPRRVYNNTVDFRIYEFKLPDERFNLEVCFVDEKPYIETNELPYRTSIDLVDKHSTTVDYTFAETMTDVEAIADGIAYLIWRYDLKT